MSQRSHKTVAINVFLTILLDDPDLDPCIRLIYPGGLKTYRSYGSATQPVRIKKKNFTHSCWKEWYFIYIFGPLANYPSTALGQLKTFQNIPLSTSKKWLCCGSGSVVICTVPDPDSFHNQAKPKK